MGLFDCPERDVVLGEETVVLRMPTAEELLAFERRQSALAEGDSPTTAIDELLALLVVRWSGPAATPEVVRQLPAAHYVRLSTALRAMVDEVREGAQVPDFPRSTTPSAGAVPPPGPSRSQPSAESSAASRGRRPKRSVATH